MSNREDLQSDCRTVNALVSAIAVQEPEGPSSEEESEPHQNSISLHHLSIGRALARLPRPKSENNFARAEEACRRSGHRPSFHKSDIIFKSEVGPG